MNKTEVAAYKRSQSNLRTFLFQVPYLPVMVLCMSIRALGEKFGVKCDSQCSCSIQFNGLHGHEEG